MASSNIELLNIDCMEYMKGLEDNAFDCVVTSPPYDDMRDYGGNYDWSESFQNSVIREMFRVVKRGGVVVWIVADQVVRGSETGTSFRQALCAIESGFNLHDTMIWCKDCFSFPEANRYPQCFEYMFIFSKGKPAHFNPIKDKKNKYSGTRVHGTWRQKDGSTKPRITDMELSDFGWRYNYWNKPTVKNSREHGHPASFPVDLARDHIASWCPSGGRVFDPFLGSGSSAIAAHYTGHDFVGCEIDKDYYDAAVKRFNSETAQVSMEFA